MENDKKHPRIRDLKETSYSSIQSLEDTKKTRWWVLLSVLIICSAIIGGGTYYLFWKKKQTTGISKLHKFSQEQGIQNKKIFPSEIPNDKILSRSVNMYKDGYIKAAKTNFQDILESSKSENIKSYASVYLGIIADEEGKFNLAINFFDRAIKFDPKNFYAYYNKAIALNHTGRNSEAIQILDTAQKLRPDLFDSQIFKGKLQYESNTLDDAQKTLEEVTEKSKNSLAFYNLAKIHKKKGEINEAKAAFLKAIELRGNTEVAMKSANELGILYATQLEDLPNAKYYFQKATSIAPSNPKYHYNLALIQYRLGNIQGSIQSLKKSISSGGGNPISYLYVAHLYDEIGDLAQAEQSLRIGLQDAPNNSRLLSFLGDILVQQGKWDNAISTLNKTLSVSTKTLEKSQALYNLGIVYSKLRNWERAMISLKNSYDLDPGNEDILVSIAEVYALSGKPNRSISTYKEALKINPDNIQILQSLGKLYARLGLSSEAEIILQRVVEHPSSKDNNVSFAYFNLGRIFKERKDYDTAIRYFKKVIRVDDPKMRYESLMEISDSILSSHKPPSLSYDYLQKAIILKPDNMEPRFFLAKAFIKENTLESKERAEEELMSIIKSKNIRPVLLSKAHTLRGILFFKDSLHLKALDDFRRALELDPSNDQAFQNKRAAIAQLEKN